MKSILGNYLPLRFSWGDIGWAKYGTWRLRFMVGRFAACTVYSFYKFYVRVDKQ